MVKIPCGVCTSPIESGHRRYGGSSCNSCASFFIRNASTEKDFKCVVGLNGCLKNASILGKGCRRCRFDKCVEIGMTVNIPVQPGVPPQQPLPPPPQPTPLNLVIPQPSESESKKNTVFALILDSVLTTSMVTPNLVEKYFAEANQELISSSFAKVAVASITQLNERVYCLREYLNVYSIKRNEFPVFLRITICKAEFKFLPNEEQNKMKSLQINALLNLNKLGLTDNRVSELTILSQNILSIFTIFFERKNFQIN